MQILCPNHQTRESVVRAVQSQNQPVGWVLQHKAGIVWNQWSDTPSWITRLIPDVKSTVQAISNSSILGMGNDGLSATADIYTSTYQGMSSDDYIASQLLRNVRFVNSMVVQGVPE